MSAPVYAGELYGVTMPDSIQVGGKTLVLNGMGLRRKAFIKVYIGGLYLPTKMQGSNAIIAADTERRIVMDFVRNVGGGKICGAWKDGLANNTPGASAELKAQFETLCTYMADMSKGQKMIFTYIPGTGTEIKVAGAVKGSFPGKAFSDALWNCLIGKHPPGADFKAGLVSGK